MDESNRYDEIDLLKLFEVVRKNLLLFLVICTLMCDAAFLATKLLMKEKFTARANLIVVQNASASQNYTYSDLQASQRLAGTYSQIIMSDAIADPVVNSLNEQGYEIDQDLYRKCVSVSSANNTEVININVVTTDPILSARMANEIAKVFETKIYDIMKIENVATLSEAKVPEKKSGPSVLRNVAIGLVAGLLICGLITIYILMTDTLVTTEEEVKQIFDYPIIGSIPDFEIRNKEADSNE